MFLGNGALIQLRGLRGLDAGRQLKLPETDRIKFRRSRKFLSWPWLLLYRFLGFYAQLVFKAGVIFSLLLMQSRDSALGSKRDAILLVCKFHPSPSNFSESMFKEPW